MWLSRKRICKMPSLALPACSRSKQQLNPYSKASSPSHISSWLINNPNPNPALHLDRITPNARPSSQPISLFSTNPSSPLPLLLAPTFHPLLILSLPSQAYRCGATGAGGIFLICLIKNSLSSINCSSSVLSSKKCDRKCNSFSLFIIKIFCTGTDLCGFATKTLNT